MDWARFNELFGTPGVDHVEHLNCGTCGQISTVRTPWDSDVATCPCGQTMPRSEGGLRRKGRQPVSDG